MAVLTVAVAVIFYGYIAATNIYTEEMSDSNLMIEANRPIEQISKELRSARQIVNAGSRSITFWYKDTNNNSTREAGETISYTWYGTSEGNLYKTVSADAYIVATGVKNFALTYNSTTAASLITINIAVKKGTKTGTVESIIRCRNL